ncbi:MAG: 50S ribosomal protein L29 [Bacteroidetes bacterium]|nr:50S ribosomal protein L29 [Bacteroidota bacterium]HET6245800.1 50S ribosomal protein L29 [Bacteroidia bacterium]
MKQSVINELSTNELREKTTDEQAILAKMKLTHTISPLENPMKIKGSRRTIARLKTELTRRIKLEASKK